MNILRGVAPPIAIGVVARSENNQHRGDDALGSLK